jgi:recombinational DNA repair protein RecT
MAAAAKPAATATAGPKLYTPETAMQQLVVVQADFDKASAAGLPIKFEAEASFALSQIMRNDELRACTPQSLAAAMRNMLHVGLTLNPIKSHGYLEARWNKDAKIYEAAFRPMYRGLVYLGTQAGIHDIVTDVVYEADTFDIEHRSDGDWFVHKINVRQQRGIEGNPCIGAYNSARMPKSGERKIEWVPIDDLAKMRDQSDSYWDKEKNAPRASSPWVKWFDEQAKKSTIKRASKHWEEAMEENDKWQRFRTAVVLDHQAEGGRTFDSVVAEQTLTIEQIGFIETKAGEIPGLKNVSKMLGKICGAYGVQTLSQVPASKYEEILERIEVSKNQMAAETIKNKK